MSVKRLFVSVLTFVASWGLFAQKGPGNVLESFRAAEQELVLLKNERHLIPLQGLDTLRIALAEIGLKDGEFQSTLQKYTRVETLNLPRTAGPEEFGLWARSIRQDYDLVLIGVSGFEAVQQSYHYPIQSLIENNRTIVVVFADGEVFRRIEPIGRAEAVVFTPQNAYAHTLAAQLLFGGVGARGHLREGLNAQFREGAGLSSEGGLRLRYSPPEVVGMDAQKLQDSIRSIVEGGIRRRAYPGAQVVVAKDGHVVFQGAFGYQTYDSLQAVNDRSIYDYASMTKITGALPALMKLYGDGKFNLDAPLKTYFPEFRRSNKADLTFREMLAHQARLRAWIPYWQGTLRGNARYPWKKNWDPDRINDGRFKWYTLKEDSSRRFPIKLTDDLWLHRKFKKRRIYKAIRKSPLREEPGYLYSGLLFYLLPEIVSDLTGADYETYIKKTFYHRIGAYTITYNPLEHFPLDRIVPTERDTFFRLKQIHGIVHDEGAAMMGGISSNAGLFSTANDLAKLMQMYLNFGSYGGEQLIPEAAVREFTRYQYEDNQRGLGFDKPLREYDPESSYVARSASPASFGHSGYTGTFAWADPEENLLLVFFSNRVYPTRENRKLYTLSIRPRLHQALYDSIVDGKL